MNFPLALLQYEGYFKSILSEDSHGELTGVSTYTRLQYAIQCDLFGMHSGCHSIWFPAQPHNKEICCYGSKQEKRQSSAEAEKIIK